MPTSANLLHVTIESDDEEAKSQLLLATTADRRMTLLRTDAEFSLLKSYSHLQDSPILSCVSLGNKPLITLSSGMSGEIVLYDHEHDETLEKRRDHSKYVVEVTAHLADNGIHWCATAGWDGKILVYVIKRCRDSGHISLGPPVAIIHLPTNPQAILFVEDPNDAAPILIATRREATTLNYYSLSCVGLTDPSVNSPVELDLLGVQNLAPHSNSWIAFSPSSMALCPTDSSVLAVATSSVPHMKLIIVRMLLPASGTQSSNSSLALTQAAQARDNLALQDREDAAIRINVSTMAPQTLYSTPQIKWRHDASGIWVSGDDGALRGIETRSGKIVCCLEGGHEAGSKIRSIWAGLVDFKGRQVEWLVSGGFDKRLVIWKPEKDWATDGNQTTAEVAIG